MDNLSPYQRATKWYFLLIGTVIFLIGAFGVYYAIQEGGSFNAGGVYIFGFFAIVGIIGLFYSHHAASKFRKELPEGDNESGLQFASMNKEMQQMEFRRLPALILGFIGLVGIAFVEYSDPLPNIQISASFILVAAGIIGFQAYKHELFVIYPTTNYGGIHIGGWIRKVYRGKDAKRQGKILMSICIIGLISIWIILPILAWSLHLIRF